MIVLKPIVVLLGTGGVGKTTCSLALAQALAARGRRVLLLTVDPAARLHGLIDKVRAVHPSLEVTRVDVPEGFARFIRRHAADDGAARKILGSRFLPFLSRNLPALHEHVAGDVILEAVETGRYDHVVVDTPPFVHAVHFLQAPERLREMASAAARLFALKQGLPAGIEALPAFIFRGLAFFLGRGFVVELVEFIAAFGGLWKQLAKDAEALSLAFRAHTTFVAVVVPDTRATSDLLRFLAASPEWVHPSLLLVNRVVSPPHHAPRDHAEEQLAAIAADQQHALGSLAAAQPALSGAAARLPILPGGLRDRSGLDRLAAAIAQSLDR